MKILILTLGSRGDVQPYVALAQGLQRAGHAVGVCTSRHFAGFVEGHGIDYHPMDNGFVDLMSSMEGRAGLEGMGSVLGAARTLARLVPRVGPLQLAVQQDAWLAAMAVRPDVIVFHPKLAGAVDIAAELGAMPVLAPLFPQYVPTDCYPAVGLPDLPLGNLYRRATFRLVHAIGRRVGRGPVSKWRRRNGLAPPPPRLGLLSDASGRPVPVLHGHSPTLSPRPPDWPANSVVSGHWPLRRQAAWTPPTALSEFLAAGPPPVYAGFGSMAGREPARLAAIVIDAIAQAGGRGLVASGWGGLSPASLPPGFLRIDDAPHDWLFPKVAAVIHHGGAGTTHAGLRAGRPTIVCPFFGDQFFWGRRVHALGAGPRPIRQRKLTAERLAAAIAQATTDAGIIRSADAIGARIRDERGVDIAVGWIERWASASGEEAFPHNSDATGL